MIDIDLNKLTRKETHMLLTGTIYPRPIALVLTLSEQGVINVAPFSYFNIVSVNPPCVSISVQQTQTGQKDTSRNILNNKRYIIHLLDKSNFEEAHKTAKNLPPNESELDLVNFTIGKTKHFNYPYIKESQVYFECMLHTHLLVGDADLIIGEIKHVSLDSSRYINHQIEPKYSQAVARAGFSDYVTLDQIIPIKRPE